MISMVEEEDACANIKSLVENLLDKRCVDICSDCASTSTLYGMQGVYAPHCDGRYRVVLLKSLDCLVYQQIKGNRFSLFL